MSTKTAMRHAYENRLRRYYSELVRRQRHGLPMTPSAKELDNFVTELRMLCAEQSEQQTVKAA